MRFTSGLMGGVGLLLAVTPMFAAEFQVVDGGLVPAEPFSFVRSTLQPREASLKEPDRGPNRRFHLSIPAGNDLDNIISAVLDVSEKDEPVRLVVDGNNNGDLTDDPPAALTAAGGRAYVSVAVPGTVRYFDGTERSVRAKVRVLVPEGAGRNGGPVAEWVWLPTDHLEGRVTLGSGKAVLMGLYDAGTDGKPANGCFDDVGVDRIRVDANGDGKLDPSEESLLSTFVAAEGKLWSVAVDAAGMDVRAAASAAAGGTVDFRTAWQSGAQLQSGALRLTGRGSVFKSAFNAPHGLLVPAGDYRVETDQLRMQGASGGVWFTALTLSTGVSVRAEEPCRVTVGAPMKTTPQISGTLKPGQRVSVSTRTVGAAGEAYQWFGAEKDGLSAPFVTITDAKGALVSKGKMEFG